MCVWFVKQVYLIRLVWLMLNYLKRRVYVQVDRHWKNVAKYVSKCFLECEEF